jgi:hypothetical protein
VHQDRDVPSFGNVMHVLLHLMHSPTLAENRERGEKNAEPVDSDSWSSLHPPTACVMHNGIVISAVGLTFTWIL